MTITETLIEQFAGNPQAVKTAQELVEQGGFISLSKSEDESVLFGSCVGSGAKPYLTSVDFLDPQHLVGRCNCPSRQKPCKHCIGLLSAWQQGIPFTVGAIPEQVAEARSKDKAKAEKDAKPVAITKAKAASEAKKCAAQLDGVTLAEKVLRNIVLAGVGAITDKTRSSFDAQVKELGNYYISGVQAGVVELLALIETAQNDAAQSAAVQRAANSSSPMRRGRPARAQVAPVEAVTAQSDDDPVSITGENAKYFGPALRQITYLHALLGKGKTYLEHKKADYEAFPNMTNTADEEMLNSSIEEQLGYGWKLPELKAKGRMRSDAELLQVSFSEIKDDARQQWIDEGIWLSLNTKDIFITEDFRPYRAKNRTPLDSFFKVLTSSEFYVFPGDRNPRVRWEKQGVRDLTAADFSAAIDAGNTGYAAVIKAVKAQIRTPLADKEPIFALKVARLGVDNTGAYSVFDAQGTRITLRLEQFGDRLRDVSREQVEGKTLIARFRQDMVTDSLYAVPLSLITGQAVLRFW
jgi:hypothetical protein